jgi:hypothetical protein
MNGMQKMSSYGLSIPWNIASSTSPTSFFMTSSKTIIRTHNLRPIRLLKTSLKRLRPSRFFWSPGCRKLVRMAFRHVQTSLYQHHQSRFLRRQEGRLWILWTIRLFKVHLSNLYKSLFSMHFTFSNIASSTSPKLFFYVSRTQIVFSWQFAYLEHHARHRPNRFFFWPRMYKMIWNGISTSWNIASSTSH